MFAGWKGEGWVKGEGCPRKVSTLLLAPSDSVQGVAPRRSPSGWPRSASGWTAPAAGARSTALLDHRRLPPRGISLSRLKPGNNSLPLVATEPEQDRTSSAGDGAPGVPRGQGDQADLDDGQVTIVKGSPPEDSFSPGTHLTGGHRGLSNPRSIAY